MKTKEQFRTLRYTAPKTKQSITLEVGNKGTIKQNGTKLKQRMLDGRHGYMYVWTKPRFTGMLPVHKLVALAWVDGKTSKKRFVDHIDADRQNNKVENLRWVTRKMNNKAIHAKIKNMHNNFHSNELLKATKGDQTLYFMNGRQAAKAIGCSRVLVYRAANPNDWSKSAKGWTFEWVPLSTVDIKKKED